MSSSAASMEKNQGKRKMDEEENVDGYEIKAQKEEGHEDVSESRETKGEAEHPTKKHKKITVDENVYAYELSAKRRVTVRKFKNMPLVDIREYYSDGHQMKPGSKGISLTTDQWKMLKDLIPEIDILLADL